MMLQLSDRSKTKGQGVYKKILLPLDLANDHQRVMAIACEFARAAKAEVLLLHVVQTIPGLPMETEHDFYRQLEAASHEVLTKVKKTFSDQDIQTGLRILRGNRGEQVLDYAVEHQVDLIILRSPRVNPAIPHSGMGSLSWKLGLLAPCDVLLVR
jgi:nucleotide-binding universal stress UspA family protein